MTICETKDIAEIVKNVIEVVVVVVGVGWFIFRVWKQKQYQRLTAEVAVKPVDAESRKYKIVCKITNKALARIEFDNISYKIGTVGKDFPYNHQKCCLDFWSIDAMSVERFVDNFDLSPDIVQGTVIFAEVIFIPKLAGGEKYIVKKSFRI